jgi:hypothetical protein
MFYSIIWVFIVATTYVIASFYAVQLIQFFDNLLTKFDINIINNKFIKKYEIKNSCSICSNDTCKRHELLSHSTKAKVSKDFDHALEEVIMIIIAK